MNLTFTYKHILGFIFILYSLSAYSQTTIGGKVKGELGDTLISATVQVKDAEIGAATDEEGNFTLQVPSLPVTLIIEYTGYQRTELYVDKESLSLEVILPIVNDQPEVLITAIGLKNTKRSINYSATEISGEQLTQSHETNVTTALSGKIAGVQVQNSGGSPGGSSTIRIRGNNSILGNNSPLFVVDGIPVDNSTQDLLGNITNNVSLATVSNRAIDLNQEDIESMTVLKGPAASALYGIRAANGVIMITTKRGSDITDKPLIVGVSAGVQVDEINRRLQPRQHMYSNGYNGLYLSPGLPSSDENWGALLDTLTYSNLPSQYDQNGQIVGKNNPNSNGVPVNRYDNEENFFVKGITQTYNLSFAGRKDKIGYYISGGRLYQTGIVPTTDFYRSAVRANFDYTATDRLKITVGANYINSGSNNMALMGGYGTNVIRALRNTPDNFDITNGHDSKPWTYQDAYQLAPTAAYPWGASRAYGGGRGWDNPYWSLNRNPQKQDVNRLIGFNQFDYTILPWLKATYRYGIDYYRDYRNSGFANGSNGVGKGVVNVINFIRRDLNSDIILTANKNLTKEIGLTVNAGQNFYSSSRYQTNSRGDNLVVPDLYSLSNASNISSFDQTVKKKLASIYTSASVDYKKWLFLNLTGNNEWSSALPKNNNSIFYSSIGSSFVFTDAFNIENKILSYGKVRGTYAKVGNDVDPYSLDTYYNTISMTNNSLQSALQTPFLSNPGLSSGNNSYGVSNVIGNPNLQPEKISSWEVGTDLKFFKKRLGVDFTYYNTTSKNQIIPVNLPASTGYLATIQNAGEVQNKGIELAVTGTAVKNKNFTWEASAIYYQNRSKVLSLAEGLNSVSLGGVFADSKAMVGQPYGVLVGIDYQRNSDGEVIIDDRPTINGNPNPNYGYPIANSSATIIGNPNPKFNASLRNTFTYKFVTLSFMLDTRVGFDIMNSPKLQMVFNGVDESTEARGTYQVLEGVKLSDGTTNDIAALQTQNWYRSTFNVPGYYVEKNLYFIKLRDVNLSFAIPAKWTKSFGITEANLILTGRNWLLSTNYSGSDPELSTRNGLSNGLGSDFWTTPNTRSYGATINFKLL